MFDTFTHFIKCFPHALPWEFCYIYFRWRIYSATATELYLCLYLYVFSFYNGVCIFMFVYVIQSNCWLYLILVFFSISPLFMGCSTTASLLHLCVLLIFLWRLYLWLLQYVCVLHTIWSLVALHLENIVMHIYFILFVMPVLPSSLTYIHKSWLTYILLD